MISFSDYPMINISNYDISIFRNSTINIEIEYTHDMYDQSRTDKSSISEDTKQGNQQ